MPWERRRPVRPVVWLTPEAERAAVRQAVGELEQQVAALGTVVEAEHGVAASEARAHARRDLRA
jgi:hypothetical protein